ncbi:MAG: leucyl aminopeptidase [Betaproteobacteria bacterium TMED156]|nr:MAG: leucyl aminopeptidase [Betaproteobacteria bacterium TMED156]
MTVNSATNNSSKDSSDAKDPGEIRDQINFLTSNKPVDRATCDCLWVGLFSTSAGVELSTPARILDKASDGVITKIIKSGDFNGNSGTTFLIRDIPGIPSPRALLIGCGKKDSFDEKAYRDAVKIATKSMIPLKGVKKIASFLTELFVKEKPGFWKLQTHLLTIRDVLYRFDRFKSPKDQKKDIKTSKLASKVFKSPKSDKACSIKSVEMLLPGDMRPTDASQSINQAMALADGVDLTKDLGNLPPNICTPSYLVTVAKTISKQTRLKCEVLDKSALEKLGMGSFLAVAKGSSKLPFLISIHHNGGKAKEQPLVIVGKGITFDSGGISLKSSAAMDEMKYDMCGAASVLGLMKAVSAAGIKKNIIGVVATCENMPSGTATRPGDIVRSMSGKTIEILNTDAEGRLILCDALTYVEKFKPALVIDIATLTGACVVALGHINTGLFSSDDSLAENILESGLNSLDPAWRLPLQEDYQDLLKSPFADVANIGGRSAGSITAACFLWRFAKSYKWAHLDIAGTAWESGSSKSATGRPVPMLFNFLKKI